jgi:hypothetical protein
MKQRSMKLETWLGSMTKADISALIDELK